MNPALAASLGAGIGLVVGYLLASARAAKAAQLASSRSAEQLASIQNDLARAQADFEAAKRLQEELKANTQETAKQFKDAFANLASQALRQNTDDFLDKAGESMQPLREQLKQLQKTTQEIEVKREGAYSTLTEQIDAFKQSAAALQKESAALSQALRGSHQTRGRWGELELKRIVEFAGMTEHCDFTEQKQNEEGRRPDMVVRVPGSGGSIPIDSKVPLDNYLAACEATEERIQREQMKEHAAKLRGHIRTLAQRNYPAAMENASDFTVLFLPGEALLAAAFQADPDLQSYALDNNILIATPVTLIALLRTVAIYWQQQSLAENAQTIAKEALELYKRTAVFTEHLGTAGKHLGKAVSAHNEAVASFSSRVAPQGRKLEELKITDNAQRRIEELEPVEPTVRELGS